MGIKEGRWMLKNRRPVILLLAIIAVLNVAGMFLALRTYPRFTVSRAGLLGENGENLKDFRLNEDGSLISVSDDPWIYYVFGEPVNIRFLTVEPRR